MQNLPKPVRKRGFDADFAYGPPGAFYAVRQAPQAGRLYVDRFGREREDTYVMDGLERKLVAVDIWDVVTGKRYELFPDDRILLEDSIDPREGRGGLDVRLPGVASFSLPRHSSFGKKKLGTKQIEGLICNGSVIESAGIGEHPGFVIESWYAEEITYVVLVDAVWTLPDGSKAETTFRLNKLQLREPDSKLFQVPADYKPAKLVPIKN